MNVDTGELYGLLNEEELKRLTEELGDSFQQVPKRHRKEANRILKNKKCAQVDMSKDTPLVDWAKRKAIAIKKKPKRYARRKIANDSRKKNR